MNIKQAKQIPLEEFLTRIGIEPARRSSDQLWYLSPIRVESTPSFKVSRSLNAWFDFGLGKGGDILDLIKHIDHVDSVPQALNRLETIFGEGPRPIRTPETVIRETASPGLTITSTGPIKSKSLASYLGMRGIAHRHVERLIQEVHYRRGDDRYYAIAFPNDSKGFEVRNRFFKGTIGSKDISTFVRKSDRVMVFEGFFDFLSAVDMQGDLPDASVVVLNSVSMRDKAVAAIRKLRPKSVEVYCDRDDAGHDLLTFLQSSLPEAKVIDKSGLYEGFNDLNEWHAARSRIASSRQVS